MKLSLIAAIMTAFSLNTMAGAAEVHQKTEGENAYTSSGSSALDAGMVETLDVNGATVARVTGAMNQWGFVNYWIGIPAPAGKSTLRVRLYSSADASAKYLLYVSINGNQKMLKELRVPAETAAGTFVDVDFAVDAEGEWSGIVLKKADTSTNPSPWIDSISVLLPE